MPFSSRINWGTRKLLYRRRAFFASFARRWLHHPAIALSFSRIALEMNLK
jgi:hypothetical protein